MQLDIEELRDDPESVRTILNRKTGQGAKWVREQFDVPIGSFQALKHRAALMFCELELTKSAVAAALNALDNNSEDRAALVSLAKAKAGDMLELVTNEAVQLHGGIGMTDEAEIGLFLKRARVQQQLFGDSGFHRARYAGLMGF